MAHKKPCWGIPESGVGSNLGRLTSRGETRVPKDLALPFTAVSLHPQHLPPVLHKAQTTLPQSQAWIPQQLASHRAGTLWML